MIPSIRLSNYQAQNKVQIHYRWFAAQQLQHYHTLAYSRKRAFFSNWEVRAHAELVFILEDSYLTALSTQSPMYIANSTLVTPAEAKSLKLQMWATNSSDSLNGERGGEKQNKKDCERVKQSLGGVRCYRVMYLMDIYSF